jgi:predicted Zn-dependent protease
MKSQWLVLGTVLLHSCASNHHQKLMVSTTSGLFNGESLLRVGSEKPRACYDSDLTEFTQKARNEYGQRAKSSQYWTEVGNCLAWHGEMREARFFLGLASDLAKSKEENAMVKNNLAVIYLRQGRVSRAYDLFRDARELAPKLVTPSFNLAQLYVSQNMNHEALRILQQPPFRDSQDPDVLHLLGLAHLQSGQSKPAGEFLSRIPESFHSRADFAVSLAQWHMVEGRPEEALRKLEARNRGVAKNTDHLADRIGVEARALIAAREVVK